MHILASIAFTLLVLVSAQTAAAEPNIAKLAWLAGCWSSESAESGSGEHWTPLAGETMFGTSRTVKQGKTVEFEFRPDSFRRKRIGTHIHKHEAS